MVNVLSDDQVQEYLNAAGDQMTALKAMIEREQPLREMARTPLSLNVMRSAYSDTTDIDVSSKEKSALTNGAPGGEDEVIQEVVDDQAKLFDAYTDRMFQRYGSDPAYPPNLTVRYLGWLAEKLTHHNISIFLIERMQPSWLPTLRLRRIYLLAHGLVVGFVAGIMLWLYLQLIEPQNPVLLEDLLRPICSVLHIPNAYDSGVLLVLIMLNLILGLVSSAVSALFMERFERLDMDASKSRRLRWQRVIVTSLAIALLTVLLLVPFGPIESVLAWTAAEVIVYAVVARYIHGQSYASDIRVVESISWSWRWAGMEMVVGALLGYLVTRIGLLINPGDWTWNSTIIFGVVGIFIGGMRGSRVEERSRPNEGMYLSIRNAIFSALLTGPILGAVMWWFYSLREGIISGLLMMLVVFSLFGGSIVTKHLLLRMVLRRDRRSPWRYTRFLDHCCRLVFLRKVGGGYIFIHRSIQDYFCSKSPAEASQYR
jgi:hypothetical protein